jgi:hypothetical protein
MKHDHGALMGALWAFADRDGKCWPSLRTLAEFCAMPLSKVQRAVRQMESLGYIAIERGRHFVYRIADHLLLRPRSPMAETQSPAGETEGVAKKEPRKEDYKKEDLERCAPLPSQTPVETADDQTSTTTGYAAAAREVVKMVKDLVKKPKTPRLKQQIKQLLMQKHARYLQARGRPDEVGAYWAAMMAEDAESQRVLDAVDARMRREHWDDVPPDTWKRAA